MVGNVHGCRGLLHVRLFQVILLGPLHQFHSQTSVIHVLHEVDHIILVQKSKP